MNNVQKFIFIQENNFNGTKLTLETSAESLDQLLTDFADFLRGAGFQINGYLDVINPDEDFPESCCDSEVCIHKEWSEHDDGPLWQDTVWQDDEELDYDHPEANFDCDWSGDKEQLSLCPVCKIDTNTMKNHSCFDKNCPKVN